MSSGLQMQTQSQPLVSESSTSAAHRQAVERVILEMRSRLADPLSLTEMARIAYVSPFHFDRVFHQVTGIPAVQFLYALRLEAAKRLLLTTSLSVTDVCYEVGYNSLGTFTSRFTQLVGLSPRHFRRLAENVEIAALGSLFSEAVAILKTTAPNPSVTGRIMTPKPTDRLLFIGLFPTLIPQSRPIAGTLLASCGAYRVGPVFDGVSYVFAAAFPWAQTAMTYLLPEAASLLVGVGQRPATVRKGQTGEPVDVMLRPLQITDPPILIALPFLVNEVLSPKSVAR
jgi:AraC-like DNA-binding protein